GRGGGAWAGVVRLMYATPAALRYDDSARTSGCPDAKAEPSPCTHTRATFRRRRGSTMTPSSQTPSRVRARTSETGTRTTGVMRGWRRPSAARSPFRSCLPRVVVEGKRESVQILLPELLPVSQTDLEQARHVGIAPVGDVRTKLFVDIERHLLEVGDSRQGLVGRRQTHQR